MPDQNPNAPTATQDPWAVVANAPASTPAPTASPATASPATPAADPWAVVGHAPVSSQQPGSFWGDVKKAFVGPTTAAGTPTSPQMKEEGSGVSDVFHGNIKQGLGKIWGAEAPHVIPGSKLEKAIQLVDPTFKGAAPAAPIDPLNQPLVDVAQFVDKQQHPILKALTEAGQSMTSPGNLATLYATGGLGLVNSPKALGMANRLISAGFGANMIGSAYKNLEDFKKAYDEGDAAEAEYQLTHALAAGTLSTLAVTHAAGGNIPVASDLDKAVASKVADTAKAPITAVGGKINAVKEAYSPSSLTENVRRASPPSKGYAAEYAQTLKAAEPQLRDIFRENPDVRSPQDVVTAIQERIDSIESHLEAVAKGMEKTPGAPPQASVLQNAQLEVGKALDQYFEDKRGAFNPEQIQGARDQIIERLAQKGGRDPSLYEAENLRQQLNKETKTPLEVPSAARDAKQVAVKVLRQLIDNKFEEMGVPEVKEWRAQEVPLIDVRDQLVDGFAKAEKMGKWSLIKSTLDNFRTGALGAALGGITGGIFGLPAGLTTGGVVEAGAIGREYLRDLETNPNRATQRAVRIAGEEPAPTNVHNPLTAAPPNPPSNGPAAPTNPTNGAAPTAPAPATRFFRAESGFKPGGTAADVVRYEQNELGNELGISNARLTELERYPASSIKWVGTTPEAVSRYGSPEEIHFKNPQVVAEDGEGGKLILDAPIVPAPVTGNHSGESAASTEAINRVAAEKSGGVKIFRIDTRNPKVEIPVYGVDAVDARPSPYEKIVRRDSNGHEFVLSRGLKAH